jgi:hypothetical protein
MNDNEIKTFLTESIDIVFDKDIYLLKNDLSERAITHRLAVCMEDKFKGFNIDCEYNGHADSAHRKIIKLLREKVRAIGLLQKDDGENEILSRYVFPDIIVHKRGPNNFGANLLIVEVKKTTSKIKEDYDIEKLSRYTSLEYENDLAYSLGVFILFIIDKNEPSYQLRFFKDGKEINL